MRAPADLATTVLQAARAVARRVIVSRGWADVALPEGDADTFAIDDVNHHALFPRVAAIVHHGGAGTTTAAALSGTPQVIVPQMYDQMYWASRVVDLGIGAEHPRGAPVLESLTNALRTVLQPQVAARAQSVATKVRTDGALRSAARVVAIQGRR
jgi:Glycosyl transferases, related to UDP-glucuronosyltransferase